MSVTIEDITRENIRDIPKPCNSCVYWEDPRAFEQHKRELLPNEKARLKAVKSGWFLETLKEFGNCGKIMYSDNEPIGYAQYSYSRRLPNTKEYGAKKLGTAEENVAFISCLYVVDEKFRGRGLGKKLLKEVIVDLRKRGFRAVETIAIKNSTNNPSGPAKLYLGQGFHVEEEIEPGFALVRLKL